ncbi:hypothetical protein SOVF_116330, partial [Spinacia oleracea]
MDCLQPSLKYPRSSAILDDISGPDYISKLHDDILIHMLDKLPMEEAGRTSLLSKRWNGLWRHKRNVELGYKLFQKPNRSVKLGYKLFQKSGNDVLPLLIKGFSDVRQQTIHRLSASLRYDKTMLTDIKLLMDYASSKNVEELYMDFNAKTDNIKWRRRYSFVLKPELVKQFSSLVKLSLKSLKLETLPPLCFMALGELFLEQVKLGEDSVEKITSNCPSLALLCLSNCNPSSDLNIVIAANSNILHLVIREEFTGPQNTPYSCSIRAANVKTIEFASALPRKGYQMKGTLSCSEAIFRLDQMEPRLEAVKVFSSGIRGNYTQNFLGLLGKLVTAEVLTLSSWCIQVLSIEVHRWNRPPTFEAKHLILEIGLNRWEFPGVAYMLLGCHKLENLVVVMGAPAKLDYGSVETLVRLGRIGLPEPSSKILQKLEVVEFKNYPGPYGTWDGDEFNQDRFFAGSEVGSLL